MKNIKRIAAATALATGLGLAGVGAASVVEAQPAGPLPDYHWCPGQFYDPGWGNDFYFDGEPRDQGHWHGYGPWHPEGPGPWDHPGGWNPGGPGWGPPGPGW
jgi:hypothetical protein